MMKSLKPVLKIDGKQRKSKKSFQCEICKTVLKSEYYLKKHKETRHPEMPRSYICDYDGISFLLFNIHTII